MKRANRPVPIQVPQADTAAAAAASSFKLTDSGVWSEGGLVFSTAGCIIDKGRAQCLPGSNTATDCQLSTACAAHKRADNSANPDPTACSDDGHAAQQGTSSSSSTSKSHAAGSSSSSSEHKANTTAALGSSSSNNTSPCSSTVALSDLQELAVIGSGSSGVVKKVLHRPTQQVYVLKVINMDMGNQQVRRQVTREVRALDGARHPHVVSYHQSFFAEGAVTILMEFMDRGTLWDLLQKIRVVPEPYLAELTRQMLQGLSFLHDTARICHRDVKPSNLLLSSSGQLKISDFGTSSQLSNSMSKCLSWVGTVTYMSPERIRGDSYTFNTDVWSLGLLVLECALGRYPYPPVQQQHQQHGAGEGGVATAAPPPPPKLGFWELLEYIVVEPVPRLPTGQFSAELVDFVAQCLQKDATRRPSASQLLLHPFVMRASSNKVSLADLLRLPAQRQQQHSGGGSSNSSSRSGGGGGAGAAAGRSGSGAAGLRRSGSYGGARAGVGGLGGGPAAGLLRQSSGGFGGMRGSLSAVGAAPGPAALQHGLQQSSITQQRPAGPMAITSSAAAAANTAPSAAAGSAAAAAVTAASGGACRGSSSNSSRPTAVSLGSSAAAGITRAPTVAGAGAPPGASAGAVAAAATTGAAVGSGEASSASSAAAAGSPGSPQPVATTSPPTARGAAASRAAAGAGAGSGPSVTPAMAAAAAAALRESSPLLSGQLMRQSAHMGALPSRAAGLGGSRMSALQLQQPQPQQQQGTRQLEHARQSVMQPQPQQHCGPLQQQQQQWLSSLAAQQAQQQAGMRQQQAAAPHPQAIRQQQQQQQVSQQHKQGPLAQQLAGIHLQHQHQQLQQQQQWGKAGSPHAAIRPAGVPAGAIGAAGAAEAKAASAVGRMTPEKQLGGGGGGGSAQGSPVLGQPGPLTSLKPSTSRKVHEAPAV